MGSAEEGSEARPKETVTSSYPACERCVGTEVVRGDCVTTACEHRSCLEGTAYCACCAMAYRMCRICGRSLDGDGDDECDSDKWPAKDRRRNRNRFLRGRPIYEPSARLLRGRGRRDR